MGRPRKNESVNVNQESPKEESPEMTPTETQPEATEAVIPETTVAPETDATEGVPVGTQPEAITENTDEQEILDAKEEKEREVKRLIEEAQRKEAEAKQAKEAHENILSQMSTFTAAEDPNLQEKLALKRPDGEFAWVLISPLMPLLSYAQAIEFLKNYDPRTCSLDLSQARNLPKPKTPPPQERPEASVSVNDSPFKTRRVWASYAPERNSELDNAWSLKMRVAKIIDANVFAKNRPFDKLMQLRSTEESPSFRFILKTGILYDSAVFRKPYILKVNPVWVYGHHIKNFRVDHGMEIADQQVHDLDGEAAIIVRFTGVVNSSRGNSFVISADDAEYFADIQFMSDPMAK